MSVTSQKVSSSGKRALPWQNRGSPATAALAFSDLAFDAVLCHQGFQFFPDRQTRAAPPTILDAGEAKSSSNRRIALPLYQGVMIQPLDYAAKGWISGTGASAKWEVSQWGAKAIRPQYLMRAADYHSAHPTARTNPRVAFRGIARTTDQRTIIAAPIPEMPSSDMLPLLLTGSTIAACRLSAALVFNHL